MENPRPEKVAVVDEVKERFSAASAALLTEYRGLDVAAISQLRRALREAGGEYKIYKNTLVRFAARDLGLEIDELLTGPDRDRVRRGDAAAVAKALRDNARTNPALVVKGGLLGTKALTRRRSPGSGRAAVARRAAGQAGGCDGRADAAVRRPAPGPAPQLRVRAEGPARRARRRARARSRAEPERKRRAEPTTRPSRSREPKHPRPQTETETEHPKRPKRRRPSPPPTLRRAERWQP